MKEKRKAKTSAFERKLTRMLNHPINPVELALRVHEMMKVVFVVWPKEHSVLPLIALLQRSISVFEEREKALPKETRQRMRASLGQALLLELLPAFREFRSRNVWPQNEIAELAKVSGNEVSIPLMSVAFSRGESDRSR